MIETELSHTENSGRPWEVELTAGGPVQEATTAHLLEGDSTNVDGVY